MCMVSSSFYIQNVQRKCTSFDMPTLFTSFYSVLHVFCIHSPCLPFLGVVHRGGLKTTFPPRGSEDFSAAGGSGSVLGPRAWHGIGPRRSGKSFGNLQTSKNIRIYSKSNPKRGGQFKCLSVFSPGYYQWFHMIWCSLYKINSGLDYLIELIPDSAHQSSPWLCVY